MAKPTTIAEAKSNLLAAYKELEELADALREDVYFTNPAGLSYTYNYSDGIRPTINEMHELDYDEYFDKYPDWDEQYAGWYQSYEEY